MNLADNGWPVKPKGMDEHEWYREIGKNLKLTVISADAEPHQCPACGFVATIFQCQSYPDRAIRAFCKRCALAFAGSPDRLWVRTDAYLRQKWVRNGKDPAKVERLKKRLVGRHTGEADGGRSALRARNA